ncbi:MAG: PstC family ABC transporter permease, partial [Actinomycetota bacterium]
MSVTAPDELVLSIAPEDDRPRPIVQSRTFGDRVFRSISAGAAATCLLIMFTTGVFLTWKAFPAISATGPIEFLTGDTWQPDDEAFGVGGLLVNTIMIAITALVIGVPVALGLALFINEYSPARMRPYLTGGVDLLAAIPSLIFGMWGLYALSKQLSGVAEW